MSATKKERDADIRLPHRRANSDDSPGLAAHWKTSGVMVLSSSVEGGADQLIDSYFAPARLIWHGTNLGGQEHEKIDYATKLRALALVLCDQVCYTPTGQPLVIENCLTPVANQHKNLSRGLWSGEDGLTVSFAAHDAMSHGYPAAVQQLAPVGAATTWRRRPSPSSPPSAPHYHYQAPSAAASDLLLFAAQAAGVEAPVRWSDDGGEEVSSSLRSPRQHLGQRAEEGSPGSFPASRDEIRASPLSASG